MTIEIKKTFSSHGCTNMKGCLKCRHFDAENQKSLVAHVCGNDVIIADGHTNQEIYLLRNHKSKVTCLEWIKNYCSGMEESEILPEPYLASSDSTGHICVWKDCGSSFSLEYEIEGPKTSIEHIHGTCIYNTETKEYENVLVTTGSNQMICIYKRQPTGEWTPYLQHQCHGDVYYTCITSIVLKYNELCLFFGCVDSTIHVYSLNIYDDQYDSALQQPELILLTLIKGHEDWITCLDSCKMHYLHTEYLLVSGSKDNRGRIYKIQEDTEEFNEMKEMDNLSTIKIFTHKYICIFEVLLLGHTDWITQIQFYPLLRVHNHYIQLPYLLTSAMDGSTILWKPQYLYKYLYDIHTMTLFDQQPINHHLDAFLPSTTFSAHIAGQQGFLGVQWTLQPSCSGCQASAEGSSLHTVVYCYGYGGGIFKWCNRSLPHSSYDFVPDTENKDFIDASRKDIAVDAELDQCSILLEQEETSMYLLYDSFTPCISHGGHIGAVKDVCWSTGGNTFITCGEDCSTRIWGQYYYQNEEYQQKYTEPSQDSEYRKNQTPYIYDGPWTEIYRPCIHGYPLTRCLCVKDDPSVVHYAYQSESGPEVCEGDEVPLICVGCEEKTVRLYRSTTVFNDFLRKNVVSKYIHRDGELDTSAVSSSVYWSSYLPELGLTARGITRKDKDVFLEKVSKGEIDPNQPNESNANDDENMNNSMGENNREIDVNITYDNVNLIQRYTTESRLYRGTLFDETKSFYGLNNLVCLSLITNHSHSLLLGTTSGKIPEDVAIHIWNKSTGALMNKLPAGKMSITALCLSPDDRYLIAGGRERTLFLYKYQQDEKGNDNYVFVNRLDKAHKRIIWSGSFLPLPTEEGRYVYITGDRDGNAIMREIVQEEHHVLSSFPQLSSSIMCLSISQQVQYQNQLGYYCVFGLENGTISVWFIAHDTLEPLFLMDIPASIAPSMCVQSIQFSPFDPAYFVAVSSDSGVYLYNIRSL